MHFAVPQRPPAPANVAAASWPSVAPQVICRTVVPAPVSASYIHCYIPGGYACSAAPPTLRQVPNSGMCQNSAYVSHLRGGFSSGGVVQRSAPSTFKLVPSSELGLSSSSSKRIQAESSGAWQSLAQAPDLRPAAVVPASLSQVAELQRAVMKPGQKRAYVNPKSLNMKYEFGGDFVINGRPLHLVTDSPESERSHIATGLRAWDCGIVLAKYFEQYAQQFLQASGKPRLRGLELGCGTGVAGLSLALLGQDVVLTDIGDVQQAATQANIVRNAAHIAVAGGNVQYRTLDWNQLPEREPFGAWDIVFAGDVIWHETLVEPFLSALRWAASGPGTINILLAHKVRDEESVLLFEQLVARDGFTIEQKVATEPILDDGHPEVFVYHIKKQ